MIKIAGCAEILPMGVLCTRFDETIDFAPTALVRTVPVQIIVARILLRQGPNKICSG